MTPLDAGTDEPSDANAAKHNTVASVTIVATVTVVVTAIYGT